MGLLTAITGPYVYLDANIFIYALEGFPEYATEIRVLFDAIDKQRFQAVTSELTLAETLVKPLLLHDTALQQAYEQAVQNSDTLRVVPVTRLMLMEAARIRAVSGLHLPDALHAATSIRASCETFLTNDPHFRSVPGLPVVILSEHITIKPPSN